MVYTDLKRGKDEKQVLFHVIEDEESNRDILTELIRDMGHEVRSFACAEAYLSFFRSPEYTPPAAIITDNRMPGISGVELTRRIREYLPFQKIVITTGTPANGEDIRPELCFVLPKPFRHTMLKSLIRAITVCEKECQKGIRCFSHTLCEFGTAHTCPFSPQTRDDSA
ncbi:MAG: response regulator [Mariprofundaceae bacterium]